MKKIDTAIFFDCVDKELKKHILENSICLYINKSISIITFSDFYTQLINSKKIKSNILNIAQKELDLDVQSVHICTTLASKETPCTNEKADALDLIF